jgi:hypothetical protein
MSRSTLTVKDWAQIIAEYEAGDSLAQIARMWRRGSETIRAGLIARGVQTRSTGGNNGVKRGEGRREKPTSLADDGLMWVNVRGIMRAVPIPEHMKPKPRKNGLTCRWRLCEKPVSNERRKARLRFCSDECKADAVRARDNASKRDRRWADSKWSKAS